MKLISLHLPKTAGTSFGKSLEEYYGGALLRDYGDQGLSKPPYERQRAALVASVEIAEKGLDAFDCVQGHFLPVKYLLLSTVQECVFITWMRDPIDRLRSHYDYWQRSYKPDASAPHHKRVIEEGWTFEQFCLSPEFRNVYSQYLWAFPLEYFAFIGITEYFEEDLAYFAQTYLSAPLKFQKLNAADSHTTRNTIDPGLRGEIEQYHRDDVALYQRALALRQERLADAQLKLEQTAPPFNASS